VSREPISAPRTTAAPGGAAVVAPSDATRLGAVLDRVLSALALLALRARTARWSVVEPELWALRDVLDDHEVRLEHHVDELAERMRRLGAFPGGASDAWGDLVAASATSLDTGSAAEEVVDEVIADEDQALVVLGDAIERARADGGATGSMLEAIERDVLAMRWSLRSLADALFAPAELVLEDVA
jgi:DNA-binding ferritin-like protein